MGEKGLMRRSVDVGPEPAVFKGLMSGNSMDEHVCMDVDGFWPAIGQTKQITKIRVPYSEFFYFTIIPSRATFIGHIRICKTV